MNFFDLITSKLSSKEFEDEKLFFDKNDNVCLIEYKNRLSYVCLKDGQYFLETELPIGRTLSLPLPPNALKDIFVIPTIDKREDADLIAEGEQHFPASELPECLYEVTNYGIAEEPAFKGVLMSHSIIKVAVINIAKKTVEISMTLGEGVRAGDSNLFGEIENAYKVAPLCSMDGDVVTFLI